MATVLRDRRFLLALPPSAAVSALLMGIPTSVIPNPWFTRMTPVRTLDLILLPLLATAFGALIATYAIQFGGGTGSVAGGGLLGAFAIGCPICNKLAVFALGISGALTYFQPIQPLLGAASLLLAVYALRRRLRALAVGCPLPTHA